MITLDVRAKWILFSLMIHMALVYCFIERKKEQVVHQRTPFIELKELPPVSKKKAGISGRGQSRSAPTAVSKSQEQALQNALRAPVYAGGTPSASSEVLVAPSPGEGLDNSKMLALNIELERPMQAIWRQIRAHIHYHSDFFIENIEGVVRAEILVKPGGGLQALNFIEGQQDLVEWVKTALYKSLGKDFLKNHMSRKALLNLFFRFVIVPAPPPIQEFVFSQTRLNFNILGYRDPTLNAPSNLYNAFTKQKGFRKSEWNFTKQLEPYKESCLARNNITGCETAIDMLSKLGLHQDANYLKQHLNMLSNKNTLDGSQ